MTMRDVMDKIKKDTWEQGRQAGLKKGSLNAKIDMAATMIIKGQLSFEDIEYYTGLSLKM